MVAFVVEIFITGDFGTEENGYLHHTINFTWSEIIIRPSNNQSSISTHQCEGKPLEQLSGCHFLITALGLVQLTPQSK